MFSWTELPALTPAKNLACNMEVKENILNWDENNQHQGWIFLSPSNLPTSAGCEHLQQRKEKKKKRRVYKCLRRVLDFLRCHCSTFCNCEIKSNNVWLVHYIFFQNYKILQKNVSPGQTSSEICKNSSNFLTKWANWGIEAVFSGNSKEILAEKEGILPPTAKTNKAEKISPDTPV